MAPPKDIVLYGSWISTESNAAYWYRRARKPACRTSLDEEWVAIAEALLTARG
jgi:hypothetical protein